MTSLTPTQVHHTVGNDLGGTQRPSGELGWGRLALFSDGQSLRKGNSFNLLTRLMGEAEMDSTKITSSKVGGPSESDRIRSSVISLNQRTGMTEKQVGGLESTSDPVLSKPNGQVVFIDQEVPGGSN